jgi:hypothetical protein
LVLRRGCAAIDGVQQRLEAFRIDRLRDVVIEARGGGFLAVPAALSSERG